MGDYFGEYFRVFLCVRGMLPVLTLARLYPCGGSFDEFTNSCTKNFKLKRNLPGGVQGGSSIGES